MRDCDMGAINESITPAGRLVLVAMNRRVEKGIQRGNRFELARSAGIHESTVHAVLRGLMKSELVCAIPCLRKDSNVPKPTLYQLAESAPSLDELLALEDENVA